jgi:DNA-binding NtrC family response regulator
MSLLKVMVVDDEIHFVAVMHNRLRKTGLEVVQALNGTEALDCLAKDPGINVVTLDLKMPGMDGIETLKEIKKSYPLVEVIMLTGHATVESAIEGMRLGASDYLTKPCNMDELITRIVELGAKKTAHVQKRVEASIEGIALREGQ